LRNVMLDDNALFDAFSMVKLLLVAVDADFLIVKLLDNALELAFLRVMLLLSALLPIL
jgi:hypothetical protein